MVKKKKKKGGGGERNSQTVKWKTINHSYEVVVKIYFIKKKIKSLIMVYN